MIFITIVLIQMSPFKCSYCGKTIVDIWSYYKYNWFILKGLCKNINIYLHT